MSESFTERLSRFTPDGGGLDRDGLLFKAGQRSAPRGRWWPVLAGLLGASQFLTLVLLWPRPGPPLPPAPAPFTATPDPVQLPGPGPAAEETGILALSRRLLQGPGDPAPAASAALVPDSPPLPACAAPPPALAD
jgi:hypothetical protein